MLSAGIFHGLLITSADPTSQQIQSDGGGVGIAIVIIVFLLILIGRGGDDS